MKFLQLKRLEAYGFKSFADKLEIEFHEGVTAIVGPNGSGKSNITDAIRWVLGEQNVRNLRGTKAEDIIFAGSASRRALGVAEVSLTFDNADGQLPLDFQEVVVTRRLFRSGESEFYINKAKCRLKDVYDLFADTGLGRDAISVISQNKIDQVLNSKPEERRLLFEETAGITKYRNRKRESLRKLEDTEANLLRVTDIIQEIENQLEPLAEQAEKTRAYNVLQAEYKDCRLTQLLHKYEKSSGEKADGQRRLKELRDEEISQQAQVQLLEARKEQMGKELLDVENSLKLLAEKNSELSGKLDHNNSEIAILQERLAQGGRTSDRLAISRKEIIAEQRAAEQALEAAMADKKTLEEKLRTAIAGLAEKQQQADALQAKLKAQEAALREQQQRAQRQQQDMQQLSGQLALLERDLAENQRQLEEQQELYQAATAEKAVQEKVWSQMEAAAAQAQAAEEALTAKNEACVAKIAATGEARKQMETSMQRLQSEEQNAATRLKVLANLQAEYEGFGRAVKSVLRSTMPFRSGIEGAVAELIEVPKQYVTAIEIALGGNLQNVVTRDAETAKQAIAFLKKERLGRVTFLPLSTIAVRHPARDAAVEVAQGFIGYASELVTVDDKYKKAVEFLLARTIVVDQIDNALSLAKQQGYKLRIVTLEGEILNPGGSMAGGSASHRESSFLNRSGEIAELTTRREAAAAKVETLKGELALKLEQQQQLETERQQLLHRKNQAAVERAEQKVYREKKTAEIELLAQHQQAAAEKKLQGEGAKADLLQQRGILQQKLEQLRGQGNLQLADDAAAEEMLEDLRQDVADLNKLIVEMQIEKTVAEQEVIRGREQCENLSRQLERFQAELLKNKAETEEIKAGAAKSNAEIALLEADSTQLQALKEIAVKDHANYYQVKMAKLVEIQKNDRDSKQAARNLNDGKSRMHQLELELTRIEFEVQQCEEVLREEYRLTEEQAREHQLDLTASALTQRIAVLEGKMAELGTVNPNAISEYEALASRCDFLQKQSNDLVVAKEYLVGIIAEMDVTMTKQFKAAFAEISRHFSDVFVRLFGGGKAELLLTDEENVLTAGVEIAVQPPEKKLQSLSVLSGGERALTVIALMFAFLQYRPAPFSVVDEIDAPLDEANVARFGSFLKDYAVNTQFIVVTHRKGTMEAAQIMYGVTVEDDGVSKLVSVRLDD